MSAVVLGLLCAVSSGVAVLAQPSAPAAGPAAAPAQPAGQAQATAAAQPARLPAVTEKRILALPAVQWTSNMLEYRSAVHESASDLANLTGGITFGQSSGDVNRLLTDPVPDVAWSNLPVASEFPEDVRYFWIRLAGTDDLMSGVGSCSGTNSYAVFLFRQRGLFRISYRLVPDESCLDPAAAAGEIYARYLQVGRGLALAVHYVSGSVQVVDISDTTADTLLPIRWQNRGR